MTMNFEKRINPELGFDRISELPEPIRAHILSYLPTIEAVRAGILSNTWRALWVQVPILDLSRCKLPGSLTVDFPAKFDEDDDSRLKRVSIIQNRESFYEFLDRALGSVLFLEKFKLYVPGFGLELKSRLDNWVDCAVRHRPIELELGIGSLADIIYRLPSCVFVSNSITELMLRNCEVNASSLMNIQLPLLRVLCLEFVYVDEEAMLCLIANSSNIESLFIKSCHGLHMLIISGLSKLKKVEVEHHFDEDFSVKIDASSLVEFTYECVYECEDYLEEAVCEIELAGCRNLKCLKLVGAALEDVDFHCLLAKVPSLERLELNQCNCLRYVVISSQCLVHLEFIQCSNLSKAYLKVPYLECFRYENEDPMSLLTKGSAFKLKEANINLKPDIKNDKWYIDLVKFLARLNHCQHLTLIVGSEEDLIVPDNVRRKYWPPLAGVKHLIVKLRTSFLKHTSVKFVGGLLWLAPCPETLSICNDFIPVYKLLKFMYERQWKWKGGCGCWTIPISCWRHSLRNVKIENQKGADNDADLANFFCNARVDWKIKCSFNYAPLEHWQR